MATMPADLKECEELSDSAANAVFAW